MNILATRRALPPALTRGYSARVFKSKYQRPRPGTSEKPPYHAPDPLANLNERQRAAVTAFADSDLTFIHRPPPTMPSVFSFTNNPTSALLLPKPKTNEGVEQLKLPPFAHPRTSNLVVPERLSLDTMATIKKLRLGNPELYPCSKLARMFGCTPGFVSSIAALPKTKRRAMRNDLDKKHAEVRAGWSEKRLMVKAVQNKRREFW